MDPILVPTWVSAAGGVGTFGVALGAAIAAFKQVGEARRIRIEQVRPFVVVDVERNPAVGHPFVDLVIRNTGSTLATDVKVEFSPQLVSTLDEKSGAVQPIAETYILTHGIPSLPPGREYRMLFERMPDRYERSDLPRQYETTTTFKSTMGDEPPLHQILDLDVFFGYMNIEAHDVHHIAKTLRAMAKQQGVHSF